MPVPTIAKGPVRVQQTISVVMPYYNNDATLERALAAWQAQKTQPLEVVIVDDGSERPAAPLVEAFLAAQASLPADQRLVVRLLQCQHGGQSAATNVGIAAAQGDVVLLSCSDIIADPDLTLVHLDSHQQASFDNTGPVAVIGYIPYAPWVNMTPFMRYLELPGTQFSFQHIKDRENASYLYCYAPNFSADRYMLLRVGMFDERFVYGYQDTDLGKRLARAGTRFVYRPRAVGLHDHFNTIGAFVKRNMRVGEATLHWLEKYRVASEIKGIRGAVARYTTLAGQIDTMLDEVQQVEKLVCSRPAFLPALQKRLFWLYSALLNASIVAGILKHPERVAKLLGTHDHDIDTDQETEQNSSATADIELAMPV